MFYSYFIIINIISFVICGIDKKLAIKNKFRISESLLIVMSILGGCIGFYIGMYIFHHKTKKTLFKFGIPLILMIWLGLLIINNF